MRFVKANTPTPAANVIAQTIAAHLDQNKPILWLVSGGSAIEVAVQARQQLTNNLDKLTVILMDERYGAPGHKDSNWQKLLDAGFDTSAINSYPVLAGDDLETTTQQYEAQLADALQKTHFTIGLFGIGADGHTAGILPHSPAVHSQQLAASYQAPDFTRITMTPLAIAKVDQALVYAVGDSKKVALENLKTAKPVDEQPAQVLKSVPDVTIFNSFIEEETT